MSLSPETIVQIRQRYSEGVAVRLIRAEFNVAKWQVYHCADGGPAGPDRLPPLPRRRSPAVQRGRKLSGAARRAMIAKLWRGAEEEINAVCERLARDERGPPEREHDMRLLAMLAKTLRELNALDPISDSMIARKKVVKTKDAPRDDDDAVPRDIDELRRELSRRVDLIRQRRSAAGPDGGASP